MSRVYYTNDHVQALIEQLDNLEQTLGWNLRCLFDEPSADKEKAASQIFEELAKASLRFGEMSEAIVKMANKDRAAIEQWNNEHPAIPF